MSAVKSKRQPLWRSEFSSTSFKKMNLAEVYIMYIDSYIDICYGSSQTFLPNGWCGQSENLSANWWRGKHLKLDALSVVFSASEKAIIWIPTLIRTLYEEYRNWCYRINRDYVHNCRRMCRPVAGCFDLFTLRGHSTCLVNRTAEHRKFTCKINRLVTACPIKWCHHLSWGGSRYLWNQPASHHKK